VRVRLLAGVGLVGALLLLVLVFWVLGGGTTYSAPRYTTYSFEPDGVRGFHELLQRRGFDPRRVRSSLTALIAQDLEGLLFIIEPDSSRTFDGKQWVNQVFSRAELKALRTWVADEGNVVVLLAADVTELHEELGCLPPGPRPDLGEIREPPMERVTPTAPVPAVEDLRGVEFPRRTRLHLRDPWVVPLLGLPEHPAAALCRRGQGSFVLVGDPRLVSNQGLYEDLGRDSDGLRFLLGLVAAHAGPAGEVYFDEVHHGYSGTPGLVAFCKRHGMHHALVQLLLVFLLASWRLGASFGSPVPARPRRGRDLTEHVSAVANVYQRARLRREALQTILGGLARELAVRLRLPTGTPAKVVLKELEGIDPARATRFRSFLARVQTMSRYTSSREFTDLCRSALKLREEVHRGSIRARRAGSYRERPDRDP
jgi:hypothetical protein